MPSISYQENKNPEIGKIYPIHIGKHSPILEDIGKHIPMAGKIGETTPKNIGESIKKSEGHTSTPKIFDTLVGKIGEVGGSGKGPKTLLDESKDNKSTPNIFPTPLATPATHTGTFPNILWKRWIDPLLSQNKDRKGKQVLRGKPRQVARLRKHRKKAPLAN